MISEGLPCASLARTLHVCPGTITRWLARAARHARACADEHDRIEQPTELQLDEISARPASQPKSPWIFDALEVGSRYWAAAVVGRRTRRSTRAFVLQFRRACVNIPTGLVITSDPFPYYLREIDRSFGPACTCVHAQTDYRQDCVLRTNATVLIGSQWRLEDHFARSEDSKRPNTAYVERLNLFLPRSCSYLHRRTSGRVRNPERLASAVEILRCGYNSCARTRGYGLVRCSARRRSTPAASIDRFRGAACSPGRCRRRARATCRARPWTRLLFASEFAHPQFVSHR